VRCLWAVLPPAILWGASFPLALASVAAPGQDAGRMVGKVYAANTMGAIVGAVGTSVLLIGWLGTQQTQRVLIVIASAAALIMLLPLVFSGRTAPTHPAPLPLEQRISFGILLVGAACMVAVFVREVPAIPWKLVAHGRYLPTYADDRRVLY